MNKKAASYLGMGASVIDDDVSDGLQVVLMQHGNAISELRLGPVLAVQVVQVPG